MMNRVRVWDLPTRVFHWCTVLCFCILLGTGIWGVGAMVWHVRIGLVLLSLLLFRLVWGFVGGHWSRFSSFVVGPRGIWRYVVGQGTSRQSVGHNPLGSLSVLAMLVFMLLQVTAGLFSDDEIATSGPLASLASSTWVHYATDFHTKIGKVILIVLVQLHIAAVIFYRLRQGTNLVRPMLNGDKVLDETFESARDDATSRALALVILCLCGGLVIGLIRWAN